MERSRSLAMPVPLRTRVGISHWSIPVAIVAAGGLVPVASADIVQFNDHVISTSAELSAFVNGTSVGTRSTNTVTPPSTYTNLGRAYDTATFRLDGAFEEVLLFSKKRTVAERAEIMDYLRRLV